MSVVPNGAFDPEAFFFTDGLTETEVDGFSNEDVEVPELEVFPYSDIAEDEITLSVVVPNGKDTEYKFADFFLTDWLTRTQEDDFLNEDGEVPDLKLK